MLGPQQASTNSISHAIQGRHGARMIESREECAHVVVIGLRALIAGITRWHRDQIRRIGALEERFGRDMLPGRGWSDSAKHTAVLSHGAHSYRCDPLPRAHSLTSILAALLGGVRAERLSSTPRRHRRSP